MATVMTPGGELETKVKTLFTKMDKDGDGTITKDEAAQWFKSFGKVNAVGEDGDTAGKIPLEAVSMQCSLVFDQCLHIVGTKKVETWILEVSCVSF